MIRKMSMTIISASIKFAIALLVLAGLYYVGTKGYEFGVSIFSPVAMDEAPGKVIEVTFDKGTAGREAGKILEEKGLIKDSLVFFIQSKLYGYEIAEGTYELNTSMTSEEILMMIGFDEETEEKEKDE
ncbi:MAG: aminodeoxychorismate lyase [Lachnospiraceae bacterium]|nr:aminodeoxychorismate lyase [Lachnospiraceae bacterium]